MCVCVLLFPSVESLAFRHFEVLFELGINVIYKLQALRRLMNFKQLTHIHTRSKKVGVAIVHYFV